MTATEVLEFAAENDARFIRLCFCNLFGRRKNIAVMAHELESALKDGVSVDGSAVFGCADGNTVGWGLRSRRDIADAPDLLLCPDPSTLAVLPWRPGPGRVMQMFCDIKEQNGGGYALDSRAVLKKAAKNAADLGLMCKIGMECEFTLFKTDDNGEPTQKPYDSGGYLDVAPLDKCEDIRREVCLTLFEMGMKPERSHHGYGAGQNRIIFAPEDALKAADNFLTFKTVVKSAAERGGLYASFMPNPLPGGAGNGLAVNLYIRKNGNNIFSDRNRELSAAAEPFIAGILDKLPEITLFLNPLANSYERLSDENAPNIHTAAVRVLDTKSDKARIELRSPDTAVNPYLAFALLLSAGADGVKQNITLPEQSFADAQNPGIDVGAAINLPHPEQNNTEKQSPDLYVGAVVNRPRPEYNAAALPDSLEKAASVAQNSGFVKDICGDELLEAYAAEKQKEAASYNESADKAAFGRERYFSVL